MEENMFAKIISLICFVLVTTSIQAENWQKVYTKEGITVERIYVKNVSQLKFRGTGVIESDLVTILTVLQDFENQSRWNKNTYDNKIVQKMSDTEFIGYSAIKMPWPFLDRDYVIYLNVHTDDKNRIVSVLGREVNHKSVPINPKKVRIPFMRTKWTFKPLKEAKGKKTLVQFTVHSDPGGNVPDWLINFISKYIPYKTIANIRKQIKDGNYDTKFAEKYEHLKNWY